MSDGSLIFDTGLDNSGFTQGISKLKTAAVGAAAAVTAAFTAASVAAVNVGSSFTAAMSQVSATMGITRMSEDYDILAASAEEMGAKTKFSATQAAEALNYLALAGYDANKAVASLPTVLDVAAAGGIDLAYSSDMITDSMSALGLSVEQLEIFADKLAKTSQKSNTSVAQLGEAILTVGGTAKTLSGGVTELNTMLGLIADNGIKGAEGGTALRNIILSLSAPTDIAAEALARLNVNAFDGAGKMRDLSDVFADLNTALAPLTDQQKTQALNEIFNKVDLKAVNALLGTSSERFAELTGYIDNCEGAAAQMAKTMSDNLTGDMDAFSSALEGLGIAAFDKFETPMRTAVQAITDVFGELNEKLKGELGYKLENLAVQLGNIAVKAAELAIDKGIPMLVNSMEWLCDNYDTVLNVTKAVIAMIAAYKGITVLKNVTTEIHGIATALVAATTSQQAFNIALAACPWAIVGSAAIGGAVALAGYIDKQTETLKTHSENVTAIEEENAAIREQIDLLDELSETNSFEAYDTAKNELDNTISRIKENEQKIYELKKAKERIDAEVSKGMDEVTENYYSNSYTPEQLDEMDRLSQEFQDQINTLINQNNQLKTLKFEQVKTITELNPYYDSGLTGNMLGASEAEQRAMKHFGIVPEDLNPNADIELDTIEEYGRQLTDKWQLLDHQFNTGIIQTEAELYEKKKALLDEYGNSQLEEHWQYYEELYSYEKSFAEESRKLSEEWQQGQLDDLKDGYKQQLSAVKAGVSDMLSEYRAAKAELESNISGYKNKLLSVGDMFSVASETDENGNTVKTYTVENIKKQMEEMRKYHSYIKKLKASGASEGLVSELTSLDFEDGTQFGKYLSGLSETEFAKINAYYKERDALADELSQDMYKSEAEKLNNALTSSVNQALEHLPETAQNAGRQMLKGIIEGMGDTDNDLSEEIEAFTEGFTELYETALDEMDLESGFSIALSGINTYSMGQELARSFASGFNDELEKSRAEISVSQASTALDLSSSASSAERSTSKSEKITLENMTNVTVELDGETIAKYTDKKREEKERRTG